MRRAALVVLFVAAAVACSSGSASEPVPASVVPATSASTGTSGQAPVPVTSVPVTSMPVTSMPVVEGRAVPEGAVVPEGFERVEATVTEPDGSTCELCLWVADTAALRRRGLMSVTDLGEADGMAFVYPGRHTGTFWMKDTLLPLSIAFFGPTGAYLDAFDMEPCTADPCPHYRTPSDFVVAVETTQGDLPDLGIVPGSTLALSELPCE